MRRRGEEVVGLVAARLADLEPERLAERRAAAELLERSRPRTRGPTGRRAAPRGGRSASRASPSRRAPPRAARRPRGAAGSSTKPTSAFAGRPLPRSLRDAVVGAVGERVAVDREQRRRSQRLLELVDRGHQPLGRDARGLGRLELARGRRARSARRSARATAPSRRRSSVPLIPAGTSGTPASSAIRAAPVCALRLARLAQPLLAARALGEHRDHVPGARELDRGLDRLRSAWPRCTLKAPQAAMNGAEREPEELGLGHEAQEAPRPERQPERPGVEIRDVAGGEDVAAVGGQMLGSVGPVAEDQAQHRPGNDGRSGSRAEWAWADVSPAASIARSGLGAMVAREMAATKGKRLVIVESPAKAKTIAGYLGKDYMVESSIGHIRDLPNNASEIPAKYKDEAWARLGVERRQRLRAALRRRLAQEEGRLRSEGEAEERRRAPARDGRRSRRRGDRLAPRRRCSKPKVPVRRMVFHEITKPAIEHALDRDARHRRSARRRAGDAPHPRPPLRLRGLAGALAEDHAGPLRRPRAVGRDAPRRRARARADAVRRRRLLGHRRDASTPATFTARLAAVDGKRVAQGRDFGATATLKTADAVQLDRGRRARPRREARRRRRSPSPRSRRSRTRAARPRRS